LSCASQGAVALGGIPKERKTDFPSTRFAVAHPFYTDQVASPLKFDSSCLSSPLSDWSFEELKTTKVTVWHGVANRVSRTAQIGDDATEAEESRKEMAERIGTGHKEGRKEQPPSSFYRVKRI